MLPITRIVLFKHGVAHYQRDGKVNGNEKIDLSFKPEQMNDVLKSLTTLDFNNGTFAALSYDSEEPLERRLGNLTIQIPAKGAVTSFIDQMKGIHVSVRLVSETIHGTIIGVEEIMYRNKGNQKDTVSRDPYLAILSDAMGLRNIKLEDIIELSFSDENVQRELRCLMETLAVGVHKGQKRLSIQAVGEGERDISVSYVVEAPVWKTSYRLVFVDGQNGEALLQGWAMVDNTTEEDWLGVQLSLVAGLPISFIHDLYSPRYQRRPEIFVDREPAVAPVAVAAGMSMEGVRGAHPFEALASPAGAESFDLDELEGSLSEASFSDSLKSSASVQTQTQELGDLFSYEISQPVDIKRGQSALVPFILSDIEAEKILYYNPNIRQRNPMSAAKLKNSTELTFESGPITLYEQECYVGEAMLDTLKVGDEKIVPYSVELGVLLSSDSCLKSRKLTSATKRGQLIYKQSTIQKAITYKIQSKIDKDVVIYIDHLFDYAPNFEKESDKPEELVEVGDDFWRYKINLPKGETISYEIIEAMQQSESVSIPDISHTELSVLASLDSIPSETIEQLKVVAQLCEERKKSRDDKQEKSKQIENISVNQERLRKNIEALGSSTKENELRNRYILKLGEEEDQIEVLNEGIASLTKRIEDIENKINDSVEKLTIS